MIDKANIKNLYRLSPLQGGMLFHALFDEGERSYFEQGVYSIDGTLDVPSFEKAWELLVERHDALRTAFVVKGVPEPLQIVLKERPLDFRYEDLSNLSGKEQEKWIEDYRAEDRERGFDLTRDPLLRIALIRRSADRHVMVLSFHHIIMDGWCQGILAREFLTAYTAIRDSRPVPLSPAPQYREYIRWLERQEKEKAIDFWAGYLNGFDRATHFPRRAGKESAKGEQKNVRFALTLEETAGLKEFAVRSGVTLSTVVQGLWGILLGELNEADDALYLTTVSGRPDDLEDAGDIVGLFINAVPVRVRFRNDQSFARLVAELQGDAGTSGPYRFAPLAEIQGTTSLKRDIANTLLVFENYPFSAEGDDGPFTIVQESIDERTNYDLTVQVHPDDELGFGIAFDPEIIDGEMIAEVEEWLRDAARLIGNSPDPIVAQFSNTQFERQDSKFKKGEREGEKNGLKGSKPLQVVVAATFTVDPAVPHLEWWLQKRGYAPDVEIAPYNQIFQALLDPTSPLSRTEGFGILAVRFEDWIRDLADESDEIVAHLERSYPGYLQAIDGFRGNAPLIHVLLPTDFASFSSSVAEKLRELGERIILDAAERANLFLLDARELPGGYAVSDVFDGVADNAGHVPYTPEMNAAIGTAMARKILSRDQHPFKVIAVDCDNTLWEGICGEDGATGVRVVGGYRALQEYLIERYEEGFLIALCSKNNENDVWEVFEKNEGMILRRDHVVAHRINWRPKSGNLHELADELNVGINSFLFIDDSGMECAEVRENASDVLTLRLPEREEAIPRFLQHIWGLDKWQVTEEDRKRSGMYVAEQQRQQIQEKAASLEEFLAGLDLKIVMAPVADHQVPRVSQLTQRTNQFNISTIRRDESEIRALLADDTHVCWMVTVEDRFGEYGLVGIVICRRDKARLFVDTLLLSCRVLGRGVEEAILSGMRRYSGAHGLTEVEALFVPTKKNAPALHFLETWGEERVEGENGEVIFRRPVEGLPDGIPYGRFEYRLEPLPEETEEKRTEKESSPASARQRHARTERIERKETIEAEWRIDLLEMKDLFHASYYVPLAYASGEALLRLPVTTANEGAGRADYVPPGTPEELALTEIYREVLRVDVVGMRDDFFELGGHSLTAVELLSRIHRRFQTEISLREIFDNPTPELLLERVREGEARRLPPIEPLPRRDHYELSHAQRRLWALDDIQSEGAAYVMGGATLVEGELDVDALEEAFRGVIRRHESLRTGIVLVDHEPMQRVFDDVPFSVERIDLSSSLYSAGQKEERAEEIAKEREHQRFDLTTPPLLRATLIDFGGERSVILIHLHHIIADGWSYPILMRELVTLYKAYRSAGESFDSEELLSPLAVHYKEYAAWQGRELETERAGKEEKFWLKRLASPLPVLELPTDRPHPANPTYEGEAVRIVLDEADVEAIRSLCRKSGSTLFMFLLASVRALLWRYTGAREMVIGVPVAGRDHPDLIDQIGFYVNTLALRGRIDPEKSFAEGLRAVRDEVLEAFAHRSTPFDLIVGKLEGIDRETGRSPVFDVMVALQNNRDFDEEIDGLRFRPFGQEAGAGKFDLVFNFNELSEGIECTLEYRTELFDRETIEKIGNELARIAGEAARFSEKSPIDIAGSFERIHAEREKAVNATIPEGTIVSRFRETALRFPTKIAVKEGDRSITYDELNESSDRVAAWLARDDVKKGEIVAVVLERGIDLIAMMLGVMKRGAIYLPIDPAYPESRIAGILEDSGAVLAIGRRLDKLPSEVPSVDVADLFGASGDSTAEESIPDVDPAYVIYTSGSTGRPKGVCVGHRGFVNMIAAQIATFGVGEEDNVLQFASPAFDASLSEIFMALLAGATLTIARREDVEEIESFLRLLQEAHVSVATIPPVYLRAIERRPLPTLRVLITAGEEAPRSDVLFYAGNMSVFNAYGPTECSVCATIHRVDPDGAYGERIPIGEAISGVGAFIADEQLLPLPDGVAGELILYGAGLAEGYVDDVALTEDRFVSPSWFGGGYCYRTGDRARRLRSGEFEFLGRVDNQVKIRGHRVEPEEARQGLLRIPSVRDAAILVVDEPSVGKSLVAYVCGDESLDPVALQGRVTAELPTFLQPQSIHFIDSLPITVNGKVDRKKLEELYRSRSVSGDPSPNGEPRTEIEAALARAFAEVLRRDSVGIHENFFAIGGDSMKAIQVRAALGRLGYDLRSRHIFEGGTVARIAGYVEASVETYAVEEVEGAIPLTPVQEWLMERLGPADASGFGLSLVADASEPLDPAVLKAALSDLIDHHHALRIRAARDGESISLTAGPRVDGITLSEFDLRGSVDVGNEIASLLHRLSSDFIFDGASPLFNAGLIRTPDRDVVVLGLHHLTVDALSLEVLLEDLNEAYTARLKGTEPKLAAYGASFGAWSRSLDRYAESIPHEHREEWVGIARRVREGDQPFDSNERSNGTRSFILEVDRSRTDELRKARRRGIDLHHLLIATLRRTVEELTGCAEPAMMIEGHGRSAEMMPDVTRTVGWFTAFYPALFTATHASLHDELREIRTRLDAVKEREAEYGALRYRAQDGTLRDELKAAPQISFNYLGEYWSGSSVERRRAFEHTSHVTAGENRSLSDLELHALVEEGIVKIRCTCGPTVPDSFASEFRRCFLDQVDEIVSGLNETDSIGRRLICVPYIGGDARSFESLAAHLPASVETLSLELPGHGDRIQEPPLSSVEEILSDLIEQTTSCLDRPYILFGHSLGALLVYELAHKLRERGAPDPEMLVCSGASAPRHFGRRERENGAVDEEVIAAYYSDGGGRTDEEIGRMIAAARADLKAVGSYLYVDREKLDVPITVLYGSEDDIPMEIIAEWNDETNDDASFHEIEGGHDYVTRNAAATAEAIMQACDSTRVQAGEEM